MSIDEYRKSLVNYIESIYLKDINFDFNRNINISDINGLSDEFYEYFETHETFKRNVEMLIHYINRLLRKEINDHVDRISSKVKLTNWWYYKIVSGFKDYYRNFTIACGDAFLTDNEIAQISQQESLKDIILSNYNYLKDNENKKVFSR